MGKLRKNSVALTVLLIALLCLTVTAHAATIVKSGKCGAALKWTIDSDGVLTISGKGAMYDYPAGSNNYKEPWADYSFSKLVIESGVTTIGSGAFDNSSKAALKQIRLPNTLTTIENDAFAFLNLESIEIPNTVTSIGQQAFLGCSNLKEVRLSNKLKTIPYRSFDGCSALETIVIPDSVTTIDAHAFCFCTKLEEVTFSQKLKTIGREAFRCCSALGDIVLPDSVTSIGVSAFEDCTSIEVAYLPMGLEKIPYGMFRFCSSLQAVLLPAALETVETAAFADCTNLKEIYFPGEDAQLAQLEIKGENDPLYEALLYLVTLITEEPQDVQTQPGKEVSFRTATSRKDVTYQWHYKTSETGAWKPCKSSSAKTAVLTFTATESKNGYWYFCEITDPYGNTGSTRAAKLTVLQPLRITDQPKTMYTKSGETAKITVKATGEGLKYQWYIRNASSTKYSKSSVTGPTYSVTMSSKSKDRRAYCVITDSQGNKVQSKTVVLRMAATVTTQPKTSYTQSGATATATVKAAGDGLKYQWYIRNANSDTYSKSSITAPTYSVKMSSKAKDRRVYCVITDAYGNKVQSKTVILRMAATVTTQPVSVTAAMGKTARVTFTAAGDGLKYVWYYKNPEDTGFTKTTSFTGKSYSVKMTESRAGRQVYCKITDKYGYSVKTNTVTLKMK